MQGATLQENAVAAAMHQTAPSPQGERTALFVQGATLQENAVAAAMHQTVPSPLGRGLG
ncbi:hypothetical protein [Serratia oryzae]|uniref:hypothetical protein n=1 Tax=Serratia oryzae TaxID=2034155 RepID=UPI001301196B|nr:hypothetical protein [Serratia oryzae]